MAEAARPSDVRGGRAAPGLGAPRARADRSPQAEGPPEVDGPREEPAPEAGRAGAIAAFLRGAGWGGAARAPLAGDASARRYERLRAPSGAPATAVLMDAPPEQEASVRAFVEVAGRLAALGLSPPAIRHAEPEAGLLLLEDLGDALLARQAQARPEDEPALYAAAADALVRLRRAGPEAARGLPVFDADAMAEAASLAATAYAGRPDARWTDAPWSGALRAALLAHAGPADTLILRDFHAENLLWLPERRGAARLGLLDFQDAMRGPAAYDLASLLRDARRDVSPEAARAATARFAEGTGTPPHRLDAALAVLGAQRALRILGVFARLARAGRPAYLRFVPRVWGQLVADLDHPACEALRGRVLGALPPPEAAPAGLAPA